MEGGQGLVWRSSFVSAIYRTTFYRNKISLVFHTTPVLSDKIGGYLLTSKLLRTYRVIQVIIPICVYIVCY
jgi:hypothetical protein